MVFKFGILYIACVLKNKHLPLGWRSISAVCILNVEIAIVQSVLGQNISAFYYADSPLCMCIV